MTDDPEIDIQPACQRIIHERSERLNATRAALKTGVPFLDRALGGIRRNDLLLVGAGSGVGKTELAATLVRANCELGKRVHVFALEAEEREFERRILYKLIAEQFFRDKDRPEIELNYRDWLFGELDDWMEVYEMEAQRVFEKKYPGLTTIYRRSEFSLSHFEKTLSAISGESDLVVIDHLNYFDFDDSIDEARAVSRIIKRVRDLALLYGLPMVVLAHIRKRDRKVKSLMPELEDFHGTSNIYKVATASVLLSAAPRDAAVVSPRLYPTYMRAAKFRIDGSATRFVARVTFNIETNEYEKGYQLGHFRDGMETFEPITNPSELPRWARVKEE